MDEEIREKIALKRYQIISPVLAEPKRAQNDYFRKQADIEHHFPHYGVKKVGVSTMKSWLRTYREKGFAGLKPNARSDKGRPRRFDTHLMDVVSVTCKAYPYWSIQNLYEHLQAQDLLGRSAGPLQHPSEGHQRSWTPFTQGPRRCAQGL
jgi:hypothetical protein